MLIDDVTRYVALYRRLGRSFAEQSRTLHLFARFAAARGDSHVRVACVHDWCATASSPSLADMLSVDRGITGNGAIGAPCICAGQDCAG